MNHIGVLLNGSCDADANCGTLDSHCKNGTCTCFEDFTTFEDSCVKGMETLLSEKIIKKYIPIPLLVIIPKVECKSNAECKFRARATCVKGICTCRPFHHEENGQCIKSKGIYLFK